MSNSDVRPGTRIQITGAMPDEPDPLEIGARGTVTRVSEGTGQIFIDWDNGRRLILLDTDPFDIVTEQTPRVGEAAVLDLSKPVEVPPLHWHEETDPGELANREALQWITALENGFGLRITQSALDEDRGEITLRIYHEVYDDPGWADSQTYASVEEAKQAAVDTIAATLRGELTRVAVRAVDLHDSERERWTIVDCPIDALGNYDAEASEIYPRLPQHPNAGGSVGFRGAVIVVDGCHGFTPGCSTWSHCDGSELDQARREHWDCEHDMITALACASRGIVGGELTMVRTRDKEHSRDTQRRPARRVPIITDTPQ